MTENKFFARGFEDYLKFGILMGFSILMLKLILDGNIGYYINPKLLPLVVLSSVFLILIAFVLLIKTKIGIRSKNRLSYMLFIIPLLMGYIVSPKTISQAQLQIAGEKNQRVSSSYSSNIDAGEAINFENGATDIQHEPETKPKPSKVIFEDRNFAIMLDSLYMRIDEYKGTDVEIMGKIYKDPSMKSNEFAVVRPMMSCCSADTALVGLFCVNNTEIKVNKDTWAKIEGKVSIVDGKEGKMPVVEVQKVTAVDKPKNEFVYPY
jgi:putative membrane protein